MKIKNWKNFNKTNENMHSPIIGDYEEWFEANEEELRTDYTDYVREMEFEGFSGDEIDSFEDWCKSQYDEIVNY